MTVFSLALTAIACCLSLASLFVAARAAARVSELREIVRASRASLPESLAQRMQEIEETLEVMANKQKMQRVRAAASHATSKSNPNSDLPDPHVDPDGWRTAMNRKLGLAKLPS